MSDLVGLEDWKTAFATWIKESQPLFAEGKAKEAFGKYPWVRRDSAPFHRLDKPVSQSRVALLTTGGYSIDGLQEPFKPFPSFDDSPPGVREIPMDVDREKLVINHPGYDHRFAEQDINVNLPLDRLREMVDAKEIGSIVSETQVIMGLQPNVEPLLSKFIPSLVSKFKSDSVEAALLVPS